jgi:hypothetical protein
MNVNVVTEDVPRDSWLPARLRALRLTLLNATTHNQNKSWTALGV